MRVLEDYTSGKIKSILSGSHSRALERNFRKWFRKQWKKPRWLDTYEPTMGTGFGFPDAQIALDGILQPIELKVAELGRTRTAGDPRIFLLPSEIRPAQKLWHFDFDRRAGGCSFFLAGIPIEGPNEWLVFAFAGTRAYVAEAGLIIGKEAFQISGDNPEAFAPNLEAFTRDYRKGHFR